MTSAPPSSAFSSLLPAFQLVWDSTSLGLLKECPEKYRLMMIEQWSPRSRGVHLAFGGWYASGLEHYAHYRARGMSHDDATVAMVRWVLEASGERDADGVWTPWSPGDHKDANIKNRYTLIRSLVWNVEERANSPFRTLILANGKPAVELSFNFTAFEVGGEEVSLAGHLDEVVTENDGKDNWIRDDKTTKRALDRAYFKQWSPHGQMSQYTVAGKLILARPVRGVLVKAAHIGVGFTRFATQPIPRPQPVLDEWMRDTEEWISLAHRFATRRVWPKNDKSCGNYGGCPFQEVCSVSPTHRAAWLQEGFEKRVWNPLESRGDI